MPPLLLPDSPSTVFAAFFPAFLYAFEAHLLMSAFKSALEAYPMVILLRVY